MATVTISTIKHIKHLDGPVDGANNESTTHVKNALLYFDHGAQAVAGGDTLSLALNTLIQNATRSGKTVTVREAAMAQSAWNLTDGVAMGWKTVSLSTNTLTFIPTTSDYSTNVAIDASDKVERPFAVFVCWSEA